MTRYRGFGLEIDSEIDLAELAFGATNVPPDLRIVSAPARPSNVSVTDAAEIRIDEGVLQIAFAGVATFSLRPERDLIEVEAVRGAESLVSLPLLGPVLALWLHLKGDLVLHASAVAWEGGAYALLGDKGAGKSTTAAALLACGAQLVTDDLLRLRWADAGPPLCEPAYAQVKLTEPSAKRFAPSGACSLASPHPDFTKQRYRLTASPGQAAPLRSICALARGMSLSIERLAPAEALKACMEQVFVRRYGAVVVSGPLAARQFSQVAKLVKTTPVFQLCVPDGLETLKVINNQLMRLLETTVV